MPPQLGGPYTVIAKYVGAAAMARRFAEAVKEEPAVRQLWFRQLGPLSEFWLVTESD